MTTWERYAATMLSSLSIAGIGIAVMGLVIFGSNQLDPNKPIFIIGTGVLVAFVSRIALYSLNHK